MSPTCTPQGVEQNAPTESTTFNAQLERHTQFTLENWYMVEVDAWGSQPNGSYVKDESQDAFYIYGRAPAQGGGTVRLCFHASAIENYVSGQILTLTTSDYMAEYTFTLGTMHRHSYRWIDPHIVM